MLLEIDTQSETAIYQQICNQLIIGIAKSELKAGELLPSVRQLADEIGINMMTVSKAYASLKNDGYIVTDRRNGTRVADKQPVAPLFNKQLSDTLELLLAEAYIHQVSEKELHEKVSTIYQNFGD